MVSKQQTSTTATFRVHAAKISCCTPPSYACYIHSIELFSHVCSRRCRRRVAKRARHFTRRRMVCTACEHRTRAHVAMVSSSSLTNSINLITRSTRIPHIIVAVKYPSRGRLRCYSVFYRRFGHEKPVYTRIRVRKQVQNTSSNTTRMLCHASHVPRVPPTPRGTQVVPYDVVLYESYTRWIRRP